MLYYTKNKQNRFSELFHLRRSFEEERGFHCCRLNLLIFFDLKAWLEITNLLVGNEFNETAQTVVYLARYAGAVLSFCINELLIKVLLRNQRTNNLFTPQQKRFIKVIKYLTVTCRPKSISGQLKSRK
jgi:hypothetical protein